MFVMYRQTNAVKKKHEWNPTMRDFDIVTIYTKSQETRKPNELFVAYLSDLKKKALSSLFFYDRKRRFVQFKQFFFLSLFALFALVAFNRNWFRFYLVRLLCWNGFFLFSMIFYESFLSRENNPKWKENIKSKKWSWAIKMEKKKKWSRS